MLCLFLRGFAKKLRSNPTYASASEWYTLREDWPALIEGTQSTAARIEEVCYWCMQNLWKQYDVQTPLLPKLPLYKYKTLLETLNTVRDEADIAWVELTMGLNKPGGTSGLRQAQANRARLAISEFVRLVIAALRFNDGDEDAAAVAGDAFASFLLSHKDSEEHITFWAGKFFGS